MKFKKWLYEKFLPPVGWASINLLTNTLKIKIHNEQIINKLSRNGEQIVFICWHGRQFLITTYLSKKNTTVITSTSRDGILQSNILSRMGFKITYGSSSKSPVRALVGSVKKMREGTNMVIAVDGPRGPIYKVKLGALFLAKKINTCIVPITFSAKRALILSAWDKYMLPLPFSKIILNIGSPFYPSSNTDKLTMNSEAEYLEKKLCSLNTNADKLVRL